MRIYEIEAIKPKTPEQLRVDSLKKTKDKAADALKAEKKRQHQQRARKQISIAQKTLLSNR